MSHISRISPSDARQRVVAGTSLLVCAYENEGLCRRNRLEGALTLQEFASRLPQLDTGQEIIFYCA